MESLITNKDKRYLRELAKKYVEYSELPVMEERTSLWHAHNRMMSNKPVVIMENLTFNGDFLPELKCSTESGQFIESILLEQILNFELINDDKVIPHYLPIELQIDFQAFSHGFKHKYSKDSEGREIGYESSHLISDLKEDLPELQYSKYSVDWIRTNKIKEYIENIIGSILPVVIKNTSLTWHITPTAQIVELMGMEAMLLAMLDTPDEMKNLFSFIMEDIIRYLRWQEKEGLLTLNNSNDYVASGSYGFTSEIPRRQVDCNDIKTKDLWGHMNSQESVGISPDMFGEFIFPSYLELANEFGLLYYGCCEPVHHVWEDYLCKLPNLRKLSISPWCDEQIMGEYLKREPVIYSRKPSPNYIGVGKYLDEESFSEHIIGTLDAAEGNTLEIIFRDIYNLEGNRRKPGRAVEIVRELIDSRWKP